MLVFINKNPNQPLEIDLNTSVIRLAPLETREINLSSSVLEHRAVQACRKVGLVVYTKPEPTPQVIETKQEDIVEAKGDSEAPAEIKRSKRNS